MSYMDICGESIPEKETPHTVLSGKQRAQGACSTVKRDGGTGQTRWNRGQRVKSHDCVGHYKDLAEGFAWSTMMWYECFEQTLEGWALGSPVAGTTVVATEVVRMSGVSTHVEHRASTTWWQTGFGSSYRLCLTCLLSSLRYGKVCKQSIAYFFIFLY